MPPGRLTSLDVFRGITIAGMIYAFYVKPILRRRMRSGKLAVVSAASVGVGRAESSADARAPQTVTTRGGS